MLFIQKKKKKTLCFIILIHVTRSSLTWYGREINDGRDHGAQSDEDPESEQHRGPMGKERSPGIWSRDEAA